MKEFAIIGCGYFSNIPRKTISVALFIAFLLSGCSNTKVGRDKRRKAIESAIIAISKYDTSQLYQLIDTSRCFKIYSKEGFLFKINCAYKRFIICGSHINDRAIRIETEEPYHTKYTIPFCSSNGQFKKDSFSLVFSFADYRKDSMIDFMDVETKINTIPNQQIPAPTNY